MIKTRENMKNFLRNYIKIIIYELELCFINNKCNR